MSKDKRSAYMGCMWSLMAFVITLFILLLVSGCKSVKYVPVVEHHTQIEHRHDSIVHHDTLVDHQQVVVREVDSATMAQYGIQLKNMQRAWLVENTRLQKQISQLLKSKADTVHIIDSIPTPYPVYIEVPAQLNWWQRFRMEVGDIAMVLLLCGIAWLIIKMKLKK